MIKRWHIYDAATGIFTGVSFHSSVASADEDLPQGMEANVPAGHKVWVAEQIDYAAQRVDVVSGTLIAYRAQPSAEAAKASALAQIRMLEAGQHRSLREAVVSGDRDAFRHLNDIEDRIIELRKQL